MMFSVTNWRAAAQRTAGAVLLAALLSACGGGDQVEKFQPTRIVAFGDENSVLLDGGDHNARKYTVNAVKTAGGIDCSSNPLWIQSLAGQYNLVFEECNPTAAAASALSEAVPGARVADVAAQVDAFLATHTVSGKDLVTVMAGQHDVLDAYNAVRTGGSSEADAIVDAEQAGTALANVVNRLAAAGAKVLITTIPNVGVTPFARAEETAQAGSAALLGRLAARFNSRLRVGLTNDGRMIGLILLDESIDAIVNANASSYANVTGPACDVTKAALVQDCDATMLLTGATADSYLWADSLWMSAGQRLLGSMAIARAIGNPF